MDQTHLESKTLQLPKKFSLILIILLLLTGWLLYTPPGLLGKADAIGYGVCHRIKTRSFLLGERQFPLCIRCSGMYLGALVGLSYQGLIARRRGGLPVRRTIPIFGLLVLGFGLDGMNSYLHLFPFFPTLYEPLNWLRLLSGTGMGLSISAILFPAFNQTVWLDWKPVPAIKGLGDVVLMIVIGLALDAILLTQNPVFLYPLAIISAAGVWLILSMVYTMAVLILFRKENLVIRLKQLAYPLLAGFLLALVQTAAFDLLRFLMTGTWDGFHFG